MNPLINLPIDSWLPQIVGSASVNLVVTATPGSGKTTRIPPAIAKSASKKVLCVEPRRLACVAAASRIAEEIGSTVGGFVGYHVRMEKKVSRQTQLCFVTTGMLLQYLCADPFLEDVSCVIFDEFHERSLDADISLAMCRYLQHEVRGDLRIIVMSATLEAEGISRYLEDCEVFDIDAPIFPLEIRYSSSTPPARFSEYGTMLMDACDTAIRETTGDILVFLPGLGDIQAAISMAGARFGELYDCLACHASLSLNEQRRILQPAGGRRRLIFSTNVAESSLTIPGIGAVIDSGLAKRKFFDSVSGLSRLETQRISKASADQRAGRAARLGPGLCIRLWDEFCHNQLESQIVPEIERLDLSQSYLQMIAWNLETPEQLPLLSAPASGRFRDARNLLTKLGAISEDGLTDLGRQMVHLPIEPRLARWLIAAREYHCPGDVALLAAYLSEAPYRRAQRERWPGPDLYEDFLKLRRNIRSPECAWIRNMAEDIWNSACEMFDDADSCKKRQQRSGLSFDSPGASRESLARAMLAAYPDRLAQPRPAKEKLAESDPRRNVLPIYACMSGNRGVVIKEAQTLKDAKFFICADLDLVKGVERASNTVIKALEIDARWIPWQEGMTARYEPDKDRVVIANAVHFDIFTLRETFLHGDEYEELSRKTLLDAAMQTPSKVLNFESDAWKQFAARLAFVRQVMPSMEIPAFDADWGASVLPRLVRHAHSFADLRAIDLTQWAKQSLSGENAAALRRLAPENVQLENGYETPVDYTLSPPVIRVRIQKAFGTYHLPRVGGGKVMVMIHLCAPNGRPAQVTQDLESFWSTGYKEVRKQLRGRYPKHDWPENAP